MNRNLIHNLDVHLLFDYNEDEEELELEFDRDEQDELDESLQQIQPTIIATCYQ